MLCISMWAELQETHRRAMPTRSREAEQPQRQPVRAPLHLRTSAGAEGNNTRHRGAAGIVKADDRRSPRSCSPLTEKKRAGTKVAELEKKLGRVQDELKKLREQLASAEAAKKDAQVALEEAKKHVGKRSPGDGPAVVIDPLDGRIDVGIEKQELTVDVKSDEEIGNVAASTDVSEITVSVDGRDDNADDEVHWICEELFEEKMAKDEDLETKKVSDPKSADVVELMAKILEQEKAIEIAISANVELKRRAEEDERAAIAREEETAARMSKLESELTASKTNEGKLVAELKVANGEKEAMEAEMRRLRVQTEQWRKATEAAASVIASSGDRSAPGWTGHCHEWGSPVDDIEEGVGGKRRGAGIRIIGDLWRKKGQLK